MFNTIFFDTDAVTCFTSGVTHLLNNATNEYSYNENDLLLYGTGFQLFSDFDEYGFPEIIFNVVETSCTSTKRFGGRLSKEYLTEEFNWVDQILKKLHLGGVIIWVNSTHLPYSDTYYKREPYIHAIVVDSYDEDDNTFNVFDPLILDKRRICCKASLESSVIEKALFDRVQGNELAPEMGTIFWLEKPPTIPASGLVAKELYRQAEIIVDEGQYVDAINIYHKNCMDMLAKQHDISLRAARRLFEHINVLFISPSMYHLRNSLIHSDVSEKVIEDFNLLDRQWRELSILALKYEATKEKIYIDKINSKFSEISQQASEFWRNLYIFLSLEINRKKFSAT